MCSSVLFRGSLARRAPNGSSAASRIARQDAAPPIFVPMRGGSTRKQSKHCCSIASGTPMEKLATQTLSFVPLQGNPFSGAGYHTHRIFSRDARLKLCRWKKRTLPAVSVLPRGVGRLLLAHAGQHQRQALSSLWQAHLSTHVHNLDIGSILETPVSLGGKSRLVAAFTLSDLLVILILLVAYRRMVRILARSVLQPAGARLPDKWLTRKLIPADEHGLVRWIESTERAVGLFLTLRLGVMACQFGLVLGARLGITIWPKLPYVISRLATIGYFAFVLDTFYNWFLYEREDLSLSQKFVLGRLGTVLIYAVAFLVFVETTGLPLRSILAFGGIGGLAVGLATQELAKNFISGIMLALGAPFAPGESVQLNTLGVSGQVRQIGFYKTELIGADGRPIWIPNAQLLNERLTNNSRITNRRINLRFGLRYQDIDKIGRIVERVRKMLAEVPEIAAYRESISVFFTEFAEYSLPIQLSCIVNVTDGRRFLEIQQQVLIELNRIVKSELADFALPTRAIEYLPPR